MTSGQSFSFIFNSMMSLVILSERQDRTSVKTSFRWLKVLSTVTCVDGIDKIAIAMRYIFGLETFRCFQFLMMLKLSWPGGDTIGTLTPKNKLIGYALIHHSPIFTHHHSPIRSSYSDRIATCQTNYAKTIRGRRRENTNSTNMSLTQVTHRKRDPRPRSLRSGGISSLFLFEFYQ